MSKGNKGQLWCSLIGNRDYRYRKPAGLFLPVCERIKNSGRSRSPNRNRIWVDLAGTGPEPDRNRTAFYHLTVKQVAGLNQIGWIPSDFPKSNFSRGISLIKINIMKVDIGKIVSTEFE